MKKTDTIRLQHMLSAAREALLFAEGRKREDLDADRMLMHTLVRVVEIIGEAASKVSQEAREQMPNIEWVDVIGMRNRLVHAYFDINLDILWGTIVYDIPKLIEELEKLPSLQ
jgi:uncharacterized protein with HEPN domain